MNDLNSQKISEQSRTTKKGKLAIQKEKPATDVNKRRIKRMRDKNAPKIPLNSYGRFVKENYELFYKKHGNGNEVRSLLTKHWAKMTYEEKQPYKDSYLKDREKYFERMEEYKSTQQYKDHQIRKAENRKRTRKGDAHFDETDVDASITKDAKSSFSGGIKIFSEEFLDYNRQQERKIKTIRTQVKDVEEECVRIREHINSLDEQLIWTEKKIVEEEEELHTYEKFTSSWRNIIIESLEKARLLDTLKLSQKSTTEEIATCLETLDAKEGTDGPKLKEQVIKAIHNASHELKI